MPKKNKNSTPLIKKGPLKTFLFFLGFSTVIWVFVQFSKQYTVTLQLPLEYINVPADKLLGPDNPKSLNIRMRDYGFNIALYKLLPPTLAIDISNATENGNVLVYDLEQQKPAIVSQINLEYEDANFLQPNLNIDFEQKAVKTVSVIPNIELNFAVGYSALEDIQLSPDTVRVSGPASILDTLEEVSTEPLRITNINSDLKGKVKLQTGNLENVSFFNDEVNFTLRTDKFTEGRVEIPIEVVNVPDNTNVVIFPREVVLFYQVSLKDFEKVKPSSFKVVVDFKNALASDGYLLAQVVQKPGIVNNVRLNEKRIQFVIKR
ncbi:YbbR-like domain-containing protein [Antarcticibacterium sp. 1MA-6-2]|uniref:CdaR family protein n=1 Tax=Antarcticibacterium sp. 1MA-6-2 TaxID=2908210 RepID=UPI001F2112BE|nr:YbbR-like domain-containing protein [Antarcticibacterium sp. 1MA-6-2]UJH91189.1 YbbR-like domain-containing protein [Antarcticibacterium sp. 1MA-6-2]